MQCQDESDQVSANVDLSVKMSSLGVRILSFCCCDFAEVCSLLVECGHVPQHSLIG